MLTFMLGNRSWPRSVASTRGAVLILAPVLTLGLAIEAGRYFQLKMTAFCEHYRMGLTLSTQSDNGIEVSSTSSGLLGS